MITQLTGAVEVSEVPDNLQPFPTTPYVITPVPLPPDTFNVPVCPTFIVLEEVDITSGACLIRGGAVKLYTATLEYVSL